MKKIILWIVAALLVILSLGVASYPFISNYLNSLNAASEVVSYGSSVSSVGQTELDEMRAAAVEYNKNLIGSAVVSDPFTVGVEPSDEYYSLLNVNGTDVMATVEIPKIGISLPIYHGTSDEVLQKGIGHLSNSSLPVGGVGTHAVLTGHTASSALKLFSDLNQLEDGDVFFVTCLGEKMAYKVNQIKTVLPTETDDLQIDPDKDYVTLVTCTPFGVNTHRLLVRGERTDLEEAEEQAVQLDTTDSTWNNEYVKAIALGVAVLLTILLVFFIIRLIIRLIRKRKNSNEPADEQPQDKNPAKEE